MYALMLAGAPVAYSPEPITWDEAHGGWYCYDPAGSLIKLDPARAMRPVAPVTPPEFKLLFTGAERVAIAKRRKVDPLLEERFGILDDPRLTRVVLFLPEVVAGLASLMQPFTPEGAPEGSAPLPAILDQTRVLDIVNGRPPGTTKAPAA